MFLGGILLLIAFKTLFINEKMRGTGFFAIIRSIGENNNFSIFIKFIYYGIILLLANFTTALLIFSGGSIIGLANPDFWTAVAVVTIFGIITLLLIEIPFVVYLTRPRVPAGALASLNDWFTRNGDYLLALVMFLLGIFFII